MELKVTITLSDQLFALLEDKLPNLGRRIKKSVGKEIGSKFREETAVDLTISPSVVPADGQKETACQNDTSLAADDITISNVVLVTENTSTVAAPPATEEWPADPKKLAEKIRAIMHRTRQRIEGEDYKENTSTEAYKKYHKELSNVFMQIAVSLGYAKPSAIDTPEKAKAFSDDCDGIYIGEKGFIETPPAPF